MNSDFEVIGSNSDNTIGLDFKLGQLRVNDTKIFTFGVNAIGIKVRPFLASQNTVITNNVDISTVGVGGVGYQLIGSNGLFSSVKAIVSSNFIDAQTPFDIQDNATAKCFSTHNGDEEFTTDCE